MNKAVVEQLKLGSYENFCYILSDFVSKEAAVIDPAWDEEKIVAYLKSNGLELKYIINTHSHFDHLEANLRLAEKTGAKIVMNEESFAKKDITVKDGDKLNLGDHELFFIHTPGHSPDSMCVLLNDTALFTGDTLFIGECGRVDLPGGDARLLYASFQKIKKLSPNLLVYPGHDYGKTPTSTLGEQMRTNYTLADRNEEEFMRFMNEG